MTVIKQIGLGTSLSVKGTTASTTTYTLIAGIVSMPGPDGTGTAVDTFTLDSTGNFITKIRGAVDPGDMTLVVAYNNSDASSKKLGTLFADGTLQMFKVSYPSTASTPEEFEGFINGMGRAVERDALITRPVTITVSGDPGFATT
jgi:hypothetical protein